METTYAVPYTFVEGSSISFNHPDQLVDAVFSSCLQSMELWNMAENKCMTVAAHDCVISALAQSPVTRMVASASHDKSVKIWK